MKQSLDDFLKDTFMADEPESVGSKDTFDDNYERWLQGTDIEMLIAYAEKWHSAQMLAITNEVLNK